MMLHKIKYLSIITIMTLSLSLIANAVQFLRQNNLSEKLDACEIEQEELRKKNEELKIENEELKEKLEVCENEKERIRRTAMLLAAFKQTNIFDDE